jgi:ubiquinone/menaquinone biosynthesis C-methylase UbiE
MIKPADIIAKYSVEELAQSAEEYFAAIQDPTEQLAKPFSNPNYAPELLQSVGQLLAGLRLSKTMTVLEFAAGTCWLSRYLTQMQCQTISCDVSPSALKLGEQLANNHPVIGEPVAPQRFLVFDGRTINLPDASVDRIVCNDAFHHIPNQQDVLRELARVLKPGGIAGFSEPGRKHSQTPMSQSEMRNFTVLENDIIIEDIHALALAAGFTAMNLRIFGDVEVSYKTYQKLLAFKPFWYLASLYLPGIRPALLNKTLFFLYKGETLADSRAAAGLGHNLTLSQNQLRARAGEAVVLTVKAKNTGTATWLDENIKDIGTVKLGIHLHDAQGSIVNYDFYRLRLPKAITPGETCNFQVRFPAPPPGNYRLDFDLVSEFVCWFENIGNAVASLQLEVEPA